MPYLKDCKLKTDPRVTIYYDYILDDGWNVVGLNKTGDFVAGILSMRNITGTPISDRDYRLAIARAKSQQALLTSKS